MSWSGSRPRRADSADAYSQGGDWQIEQFGGIPNCPEGHDASGVQFGGVPAVPAGQTRLAFVQFAELPALPVHGSFAPLYGCGMGRDGLVLLTGVTGGWFPPVPEFAVF
jgi:hypothetical protein